MNFVRVNIVHKGEIFMKADYHVHTNYSDDSTYLMEDVISDAIKKGIDELCITDHVDYGVKYDWDEVEIMPYRGSEPFANVDYPKWYQEFCHLQWKYHDQIRLKLGMEFGMQRHTIDRYQSLFQRYPFDFILLSVHQIDDLELWTNAYQDGKSQDEYIQGYYQEILYLVQHYKQYSVLAHLDLIERYDPIGHYPFSKIEPILKEIFACVIADGKGIELNTSSHRYQLEDTTPATNILKLYRQMGGTIVTIGSDSHNATHLGAYFEEAQQQLKTLGFTHFYTYEKMCPIAHQL